MDRLLENKTVVFGICGGIAAYKVAEVVSRIRKLGADTHVIMTKNAKEFVAPLTFQTLSGNPVIVDMFASPKRWEVEHISLSEKADIFVIAPATANIIGKIASGIADDMLTTVALAVTSPLLIVPAMNSKMYKNSIVTENINKLKTFGHYVMEPQSGHLACGAHGIGRLPEPKYIVESIVGLLSKKQDLKGKRIIVTAGPTREAIDPIRYISNRSSGKMGYALAEAAKNRGAEVVLISGPVDIEPPSGVIVEYVCTAQEMLKKVKDFYESSDVVILAAAVADFRCADVAVNKIKKSDKELILKLLPNPDIAKEIAPDKGRRIHIGFSAETENLIENAKKKLKEKKFDIIIANNVMQKGAGFDVDTNIVTIIRNDSMMLELPKVSKRELADRILDQLEKIC